VSTDEVGVLGDDHSAVLIRQPTKVPVTRPIAERQVQGVDGVTAERGQPSGEPVWQHRVEQEPHAAGGWMRFTCARRVAKARAARMSSRSRSS